MTVHPLTLHETAQAATARPALDAAALDTLFRTARTHNGWQPRAVPDAALRELYELAKWGPTAVNASPLRVLFVKSPEAKELLRPALSPGNVDKTIAAPVTAILAYDTEFVAHLPRLFPHMNVAPMFTGNPAVAEQTATLNATLQAGYFILAARALGLDTGPMGGFDKDKVNQAFFAGRPWKALILLNLGYGDEAKLFPRSPRLSFEDAAVIA